MLKNDSQGLNVLGATIYTCIPSPLKTTSEGKNLKPNQPVICFSYKFLIVLNSDLLELHFKAQQQKENLVAIFRNIYIYKFLRVKTFYHI